MDTIDTYTMQAAAKALSAATEQAGLDAVHTVTVTLNGAHGGADVTLAGWKHHHLGYGTIDYQHAAITVEVH